MIDKVTIRERWDLELEVIDDCERLQKKKTLGKFENQQQTRIMNDTGSGIQAAMR